MLIPVLHVIITTTGATALHALQHGYRTIVVEDACKGVTLEGIAAMRSSLIEAGAVVVHSDQVMCVCVCVWVLWVCMCVSVCVYVSVCVSVFCVCLLRIRIVMDIII